MPKFKLNERSECLSAYVGYVPMTITSKRLDKFHVKYRRINVVPSKVC